MSQRSIKPLDELDSIVRLDPIRRKFKRGAPVCVRLMISKYYKAQTEYKNRK